MLKPGKEYFNVGYILEKIYDSEIHLRIGWLWDGGIDYSIGSDSNDIWDSNYNKAEIYPTGEPDITKAIIEIAEHISKEYPKSTFGKWWQSHK